MQANPADRNDHPHQSSPSQRPQTSKYWTVIIALGLLGGGGYYYLMQDQPQPTEPAVQVREETREIQAPVAKADPIEPAVESNTTMPVMTPAEPDVVTEPVPSEPVVINTPPPEPLPDLDNSDPLAMEQLSRLNDIGALESLLAPRELLRNFVTFVDNLSRGQLETTYSPLTRPGQRFQVIEQGDRLYIDPNSYQRYDIYVDIITAIDISAGINSYQRLRPLIQQAYAELGYPDDDFSLTLQDAISQLLAAPVIDQPIELVAPSAMYQFMDSRLQALPAAQKLMIRIGSDNYQRLRPVLERWQTALEQLPD